MDWLNKQLYDSVENQSHWSTSQWSDVWAQIMRTINNANIIVTEEKINNCTDFKEKHLMEIMYKKKIYAEQEVKSWNLNNMSTNIKAIIKADLMQRRCYHAFLRRFDNLTLLNDVDSLEEELVLSDNPIEIFNWYYNMNIRI